MRKCLINVSASQIGSRAETLKSRGPEFFRPPTLDLREVSGDRVHEVEQVGFKPASSGSCLTDSGEPVLKHWLPKRAANYQRLNPSGPPPSCFNVVSFLSCAPPAFGLEDGVQVARSGSGKKERQPFWTLSHLSYICLCVINCYRFLLVLINKNQYIT